MKRYQAAIRDRAAQGLRERKHYYRLSFKSCASCGSGDLFKAYDPGWMGWETWCWTCGLKTGAQPTTFGVDYSRRLPSERPLAPRLLKHRDGCQLGDCTTCRLLAGRDERRAT